MRSRFGIIIIVVVAIVLLLSASVIAQVFSLKTSMTPEELSLAVREPAFFKTLGDFLFNEGETSAATQAYELGLEKGDDPGIIHNLGKIAYDNGDLEEAEDYFNQALAVDDGYALAYKSLGIIALDNHDYELATNYFTSFVELEGNADSYCQLANSLALQARYHNEDTIDDAINSYETCLELEPNFNYALANLEVLRRVKATS